MTLNTVPALNAGIASRNKYLDILDAAWQQHLAPRANDAPTVISTFAGAGGSSLGYSMAGYRELLAVEWDNNAVETFRLNFPDVSVYHGDIAKLSVEQCLEMAGIQAGQLDVFDGSPPCQGFSTAGKRVMDDPRNQLFREYVRLLRGLQPKVFVMENVSGMVKGKMKLIFVDILRELKASGYMVSARLMNAMYFNVPQSRQRMIFIGVRDDLALAPSHPKAENRPFTVRDAIGQEGIYIYRHGYSIGHTDLSVVEFNKPSLALTKMIAGGQHIVETNVMTVISQDQPAPKLTPQYLKYWHDAKQGEKVGTFNSNKKLIERAASFSLAKSEGNGGVYHPTEPRGISTGERKRLASYPDAFKFTDWANAVERIGNSVPPLFMRSIAAHIRTHILDELGT
jgi:DNA (cytosine-5)-methyltransferase 1